MSLFFYKKHSDDNNEVDWKRRWKGECVLSTVLFSKCFKNDLILFIVEVEMSFNGKNRNKNNFFLLMNVYAPNKCVECAEILRNLKSALGQCCEHHVCVIMEAYRELHN